uniref:Uncharacterized protein n=1 Tax=viral metagenome TaxID=1070528 RepID=A0A6H1ZIC9_9ZZZZ
MRTADDLLSCRMTWVQGRTTEIQLITGNIIRGHVTHADCDGIAFANGDFYPMDKI